MRQVLSLVMLFGGHLGAGGEEEKGDSHFRELTQMLSGGGALYGLEYGIVPGTSAWTTFRGENFPNINEFPKVLLVALDSPKSKHHEEAVEFVLSYAAFARAVAFQNGRRDLDVLAKRTFAPNTEAMETALAKMTNSPKARIRVSAALALLGFRPEHAKANAIFAQGIDEMDATFRAHICQIVGHMHLTNREVLNALTRGIGDKDAEVRQAAASAIIQLGREAKATVAALIRFLETGPAARGELFPPLAIAMPTKVNLALSALASLKSEAQPAVPVLLRRFPQANEQEQREMIVCLAMIGPGAREAIPIFEKTLKSENIALTLAAACALVRFDSDHVHGARLVKGALDGNDKALRKQALEACIDFGPPSNAIVASLITLLDNKDEDTRISASIALGNIGPYAASAIPSLEKLLIQPDDHREHTFHSHQAAAYALVQVGKAGIPALLRVTESEAGGIESAIQVLGLLGKDVPAAVIDRLIQLLDSRYIESGVARYVAGALAGFGDRGRRARPAIERLRQECARLATGRLRLQYAEMGFILEGALSQIPE